MSHKFRTLLRIAFGLLLAIVLLVAVQVDDWNRDLTTNRAATSREATNPALRTRMLRASEEQLREAIRHFVERSPAWALLASRPAAADPQTIHLTRTSKLFRFVDDVHVDFQTLPTDPASTRVDVRSQSRVGRGDLGQNPRNIAELLEALQQTLPAAD
jgi:uncharacterized protein (DUF1499 family)